MKDYYFILGISKNASKEEIKKAYRELSLKFHSDKNESDKDGEERFNEISEAYETLIDGEERKIYDEKLTGQTNNPPSTYSQDDHPVHSEISSHLSSLSLQTAKLLKIKKRKRLWSILLTILFFLAIIGKIANSKEQRDKDHESYLKLKNMMADSSSAQKSAPYVPSAPDTNNLTMSGNKNAAIIPAGVYTMYDAKWTTGNIPYRAALLLREDKSGIMRVRFSAANQTYVIQETIKCAESDTFDIFKGSDPIIISGPSTSRYSPDNLIISNYENFNDKYLDNAGNITGLEFNLIPEPEEKKFIADFLWQRSD